MLDRNNDFSKVTVILRGYSYESVRTVVKAMLNTKLKAVEITMNTNHAIDIIRKINAEFQDDIMVGAGTVLTFNEAKEAIGAGAKFILSPVMLDKEILDYCQQHHIISVPAAFSPSEIHQMFTDGADIVKVFPAARVSPQFLSDVQAPLGKMPLMVVGGINADNAQEYLDAGASFVGIGSGIFNKEDIIACREDELKKSIQLFESKVKWEV